MRTLAVPKELISLSDTPTKGAVTAPVALVEFSDFECPFCRRFVQDTLPTIQKEYVETGKLIFAFKQMPLDSHPLARRAAQATQCADEQGQFWQAHDVLFRAAPGIDENGLRILPEVLGLKATQFNECVGRQAHTSLDSDSELAERLGIISTPSFLLGTTTGSATVRVTSTIIGAANIQEFRSKIDRALSGRQ
jgi:protein-disulfide isomerase